MDLSTGDLSTWLPTPSLLPRGPQAQAEGLEGIENARFASFGHGIQGVGVGSGEEADTQGCGAAWTAE